MRLVGVVGSGSTAVYAPIIVWDRYEYLAKEEQLVIIDDVRRGIKYLGVLRNSRRYEPFLSTYRRTSYVDNPSLVDMGTLPHTSAYASLIGTVGDDGYLHEVQLPPNPGSKVYVIESSNELGIELGEGLVVGKHKYSGIEVPLDPKWLPYHVAVVGATGTGKSRLVKALIDEVLSKTDYRLIVFDHTGMDYVRYYPNNVIEASKVVLDVSLITDLILNKTGLNRSTYEPYILVSTLYYIFHALPNDVKDKLLSISDERSLGKYDRRWLGSGDKPLSIEEFLDRVSRVDYLELMNIIAKHSIKWDRAEFKDIALKIVRGLSGKGKESVKIRLSIGIDVKLGDAFFNSLSNRNLLPSDIVRKAMEERLVIVDLSMEDYKVRKYVVTAVINELWRRVEELRKPLNTVVVIDEAHNYACRYCGEVGNAVARVAREGRKWGLGIVLVTQRAIDLDTEVRGNINTWFFSKLQTPTDLNELSGYMDLAGINEQALAILGRREFYVAGLMNPLKIPVLLKVKEVGDTGG